MKSIEERFWVKVDIPVIGYGCWDWIGASNPKGYGRFRMDGRNEGAHRASWIINRGLIPEGLHVLHHCDNPSCCNPSHLFLGTNTDNRQDSWAKGRGKIPVFKGEDHWNSKLTESDVTEIRRLYVPRGEYNGRVLAEMYGVTFQLISRIVNYKNWQRH